MNLDRFLAIRCQVAAQYGADDCWIWPFSKSQKYGRLVLNGKPKTAHKLSWELEYGAVQTGLFVCHTCDVPACFNPRHLYLGTPADNTADMHRRGRAPHQKYPERWKELGVAAGRRTTWARGVNNPKAKLTTQQVEEIRFSKIPTRILARKFNVSYSTIQRVRNGNSHARDAAEARAA